MADKLQKITFGDNLVGYEAGDKALPGVVVIQEWWGVNEHIKGVAALLADKGFRVLIPDLYKGKVGVDAEEAAHLMGALDFQQAVKEIGQAAQYLKDSGAQKVGCIGFCMGGALTFAAGQHVPVFNALVPCYGIPDARYFQVEQIKTPILGIFGAKDTHKAFSGPEVAEATAKKISDAGGNIELKIYPNCMHGFFNQLVPGGKELCAKVQGATAPDEEVQQAWSDAVNFFKKHLA